MRASQKLSVCLCTTAIGCRLVGGVRPTLPSTPSWALVHVRRGGRSSALAERRQSRRRYTADNTRGRVARAKELIDEMKAKDAGGAKALFDSLMPRDKLDIMRLLHLKRTKRKQDRKKHDLPRYRSAVFERRYYFREEDVTEQSTLGRGPGGQATNRRMQTIILTHTPTGLIVKFSRFPSLWLNRRAARELLNLRLEEQLLGPDSQLGRAKASSERRRRRNHRRRERLAVKGTVMEARDTQQRDFYAILTGQSPFPPRVVEQLGMTERTQPLFVTDLFEGECQSWWPLLHHAFSQCDHVQAGEGVASVALLLEYVFPIPLLAASQASRFEQAQFAKCRADEKALSNVRRAFRCFCELFGLRVVDGARDDEGGVKLVLVKDGLNWLELHRRLLQQDGRHMSPPVLAAWRHIHKALTGIGLTCEARSIRSFFARERRRAAEKGAASSSSARTGGSWAAEACAAMKAE